MSISSNSNSMVATAKYPFGSHECLSLTLEGDDLGQVDGAQQMRVGRSVGPKSEFSASLEGSSIIAPSSEDPVQRTVGPFPQLQPIFFPLTMNSPNSLVHLRCVNPFCLLGTCLSFAQERGSY